MINLVEREREVIGLLEQGALDERLRQSRDHPHIVTKGASSEEVDQTYA